MDNLKSLQLKSFFFFSFFKATNFQSPNLKLNFITYLTSLKNIPFDCLLKKFLQNGTKKKRTIPMFIISAKVSSKQKTKKQRKPFGKYTFRYEVCDLRFWQKCEIRPKSCFLWPKNKTSVLFTLYFLLVQIPTSFLTFVTLFAY